MFEVSIILEVRNELKRTGRDIRVSDIEDDRSNTLESPAYSRNLSPTRNESTEQGNCYTTLEREGANRKLYNRRIG